MVAEFCSDLRSGAVDAYLVDEGRQCSGDFLAIFRDRSPGRGGGVWIVLDLVRWRVRHATSILAGMGLLSLGLYIPHPDDQILDDQLMRARMPEFEALVSAKRAEMTAPGPVRMVVYYKDRSLFVTANLFEFVIYDETDQIELSPQTALGVWAYPGFKQV
jgi:hypothetical protein